MISNNGLFIRRSEQLGTLLLRRAVPTIFEYPEFAGARGLMSYGGSIVDGDHQAGGCTGRILKG